MAAIVETLLHVLPGRVIVHHCAGVRLFLSGEIPICWGHSRGVRLVGGVHFVHEVLQLVVLEVFDQRVARLGLLFEVRGYLLVRWQDKLAREHLVCDLLHRLLTTSIVYGLLEFLIAAPIVHSLKTQGHLLA